MKRGVASHGQVDLDQAWNGIMHSRWGHRLAPGSASVFSLQIWQTHTTSCKKSLEIVRYFLEMAGINLQIAFAFKE